MGPVRLPIRLPLSTVVAAWLPRPTSIGKPYTGRHELSVALGLLVLQEHLRLLPTSNGMPRVNLVDDEWVAVAAFRCPKSPIRSSIVQALLNP